MYTLSLESFIEEAWDYVSEHIVSDDYWEQNSEFINSITFDLYKHYKKISLETQVLTPKIFGKILESVFANLNRFKKA